MLCKPYVRHRSALPTCARVGGTKPQVYPPPFALTDPRAVCLWSSFQASCVRPVAALSRSATWSLPSIFKPRHHPHPRTASPRQFSMFRHPLAPFKGKYAFSGSWILCMWIPWPARSIRTKSERKWTTTTPKRFLCRDTLWIYLFK